MATYYPSSSAQIDMLSASYTRDEKFASYPEAPLLHGNMMIYPQNGVEIPSIEGRNEMMFIPPTSDPMCMQTMNGETVGNNSVPGEGEQNLQGLSLSLSTQMSTAVSTASFQYQYLPLSAENSVRPLMACKLGETSQSKDMRNSDYFPYGMHGDGNNTIRFGVPDNPRYATNPREVNCNPYQYEEAGIGNTNTKSKYLKVAQQLLDGVVNVRDSLKRTEPEKDKNSSKVDEVYKESASDKNESAAGSSSTHELSPPERQDLQSKLDKLHSMLDEVDRRYKQYCQQMQILVSSFDVVAGCGAANPYTALALKTISRHFRCLHDAITGQIQATRKSFGEQDNVLAAIPRLRYVDQQLRQQRALQQFGMMRHAWRPQRGLPETAVTVLRAWLFEHFLHPYPKDSEKIMLARQTGLTRGQVANWFINARVRLWKPMVEEMYKEEFGDADINSRFSPENTPKLARDNKSRGSEDRREEMQESATSMAYESHDSKMGSTPGSETKGPTSSTMLHIGAFGTSHDNHVFYTNNAAYQMPELGNYSVHNNNQVSLALGLRQREGDVMSLSSRTNFRGNEAAETTMGDGTSDYPYLDQVNQQHRFGHPHIPSDFVA